ncbi:ribulose-phosphate 3-epimerase [Candidatus Peregrinibacteria bacterium CG11_big_fil_rev_8_21_14_0_20_46_8]|nr:MAG: ribulose-phosphate 3-epimerase [Candidatus Peregrinibacteria bacterium CG11_big_fil_rev_8_21_14_0_20_46_8]
MPKLLIAPSILSADFGKINEEIASISSHADMIHVDVMDGHFVPNITFGPDQIAKMRSTLPMDVHLMIEQPEKYLEEFAKAVEKAHGRRDDSYLTVHQESSVHLERLVQQIKGLGMKAAVALNPATPLVSIESLLGDIDMVLLMTVNPGFGGQSFIASVVPKIKELRAKAPDLNIQVDGGINEKTYRQAVEAGADILVAGSYVFGAKDRAAAIAALRK